MAKKKEYVKCRFTGCKHETKEVRREDAVKIGTQYYHKDCYQTKLDIEETMTLFIQNVNPNVVVPQLRKVINTIVYEKGIESAVLLFGVKYYITHKINLNYPGGLYYVIQNKEMLKEYDRLYRKKEVKAASEIRNEESTPEVTFTHRATKVKSFADILG